MDTPLSQFWRLDLRIRMFLAELFALAALIVCVLPFIVISSPRTLEGPDLATWFTGIGTASTLLVLSAAWMSNTLTQRLRGHLVALSSGDAGLERIRRARVEALNLPLRYTLAALTRYAVTFLLVLVGTWFSTTVGPAGDLVLLLQGQLVILSCFVLLLCLTEFTIRPEREHIAAHCRTLLKDDSEGVVLLNLRTRFVLISLVPLAIYLAVLGLTGYQQIAEISPNNVGTQRFLILLFWISGASLLLTSLIALLAARSIAAPLEKAGRVMAAVSQGDLSQRVDVLTNDETANFSVAFNRMIEALQESKSRLEEAYAERERYSHKLDEDVRRRTAELETEARKNRVILNSIHDGVIFCNGSREIVQANLALENMLGIPAESLRGQNVYELGSELGGGSTEDPLIVLRELVRRCDQNPGSTGASGKARLGDKRLTINVYGAQGIAFDARGALIATFRDITEEETRAALERKNQELAEANRLKSHFLATMSHELRTPMNSIIGYAQVLQMGIDGPLNDEQRKDVMRIMESGQNLLSLINDILDLSKIDAGRLEIRTHAVNLYDLLGATVYQVEPLALRKGLQLRASFADSLPRVWADEDRLRQVLMNLLSNAIKFTREGSVGIDVLEQGDMVQISVVDSGVGIAREDQEAIFTEFFQVDSTRTREYGGTGLGLAITRRLVHLMGGQIWVESTPGKGSRFTVSVPIYTSDAMGLVSSPGDSPQSAPRDQGETPIEHGFKPPVERAILAIDDDPAVLDLITRFLSEEGYRVISTTSGLQGLRMARELLPMVITLDLLLPDCDGREILQQLREDPVTRSIPVLLLSVADAPTDPLPEGVDYQSKPLNRDALVRRIRAYDHPTASVLVVDDDVTVRESLEKILGDAGYRVSLARSGEEALELVRLLQPQIMLLDLNMVPMDGYTVLAELKKLPEAIATHVLIYTAGELSAEELQQLQSQTAGVLQKAHSSREELLRALRECQTRVLNPYLPYALSQGEEGQVTV